MFNPETVSFQNKNHHFFRKKTWFWTGSSYPSNLPQRQRKEILYGCSFLMDVHQNAFWWNYVELEPDSLQPFCIKCLKIGESLQIYNVISFILILWTSTNIVCIYIYIFFLIKNVHQNGQIARPFPLGCMIWMASKRDIFGQVTIL